MHVTGVVASLYVLLGLSRFEYIKSSQMRLGHVVGVEHKRLECGGWHGDFYIVYYNLAAVHTLTELDATVSTAAFCARNHTAKGSVGTGAGWCKERRVGISGTLEQCVSCEASIYDNFHVETPAST